MAESIHLHVKWLQCRSAVKHLTYSFKLRRLKARIIHSCLVCLGQVDLVESIPFYIKLQPMWFQGRCAAKHLTCSFDLPGLIAHNIFIHVMGVLGK